MKDTIMKTQCLKKKDKVFFSFKESDSKSLYVEVVVNGFWDSPNIINLPHTSDPFKPIVNWLERIITLENNETSVLEIDCSQDGKKKYSFNFEPIPSAKVASGGEETNPFGESGFFFIYDYSSDQIKARSYCDTEDFVRGAYTHMKRDAEKMKHLVHSDIIESYFLSKPELRFEYKGYFTVMKIGNHDLRYGGDFYEMEHPEKAIEDYGFAADNETEAKKRFEGMVEMIINRQEWKLRNQLWEESDIDSESIGCVFDILPEKFRQRVVAGKFDKSLMVGVQGGDYVVPLFYVTKAWEVLLKGKLEHYAFMIGPEEDDEDDYEAALKEFMDDTRATRTRCKACQDNDRMKEIWREMLGVDVDAIDVDFSQFNMHLPPNVGEENYNDYFFDVPDGVFEWILGGINHPSGKCTFESVSALMEFTALIVKERKEWN